MVKAAAVDVAAMTAVDVAAMAAGVAIVATAVGTAPWTMINSAIIQVSINMYVVLGYAIRKPINLMYSGTDSLGASVCSLAKLLSIHKK